MIPGWSVTALGLVFFFFSFLVLFFGSVEMLIEEWRGKEKETEQKKEKRDSTQFSGTSLKETKQKVVALSI